jgi:methionine synthase II (cobalamin-independent)
MEFTLEPELEKEFKSVVLEVQPLIEQELEKAKLAIQNAVKLSKKHGIPFELSVSNVTDLYVPESFRKKWLNKFIEHMDNNQVKDENGFDSFDEYDISVKLNDILKMEVDLIGGEGWESDSWNTSGLYC